MPLMKMPSSRSSRKKLRNSGKDWSLSSPQLRLCVINLLRLHSIWLVQDAEKDKEMLENKLSASLEAIDSLNKLMGDFSLKLDSAEETIRTRENELEELRSEREERDKFLQR